ncbi:hypothetical protein [Sphingomonas sp. LMO-1]|uniref:AraC-like ligand-binding domain-containing protein n=1 Tax=Alterirhizorhabdus profundi TaxID=2681549 RepID=UPI0018D199E6
MLTCVTADVPLNDREDHWKKSVRTAFPSLRVKIDRGAAFSGQLKYAQLGSLHVASLHADRQHTWSEPIASPEQASRSIYFLNVLSGRAKLSQFGSVVQLSAGSCCLVSPTIPSSSTPGLLSASRYQYRVPCWKCTRRTYNRFVESRSGRHLG